MPDKHPAPLVEVIENGPYAVDNLKCLCDAEMQPLSVHPTMTLCACGGSATRPFCDGSHVRRAFSTRRIMREPLDAEIAYPGARITVHYNPRICAHVAYCLDNLPAVFGKQEGLRWVEPDGASIDEIVAVIRTCPSGALSYTLDGIHHRDVEREPAIIVSKDGPYLVVGGIELKTAYRLQPPSREHYALCRCGASKNKPFCDGSHHGIGFKDTDETRA